MEERVIPGAVINTEHDNLAVALSPDGRLLASGGGYANVVTVRDAETGLALFALPPHVAPIRAIAFSPDGLRVAVAGGNYDPRSVMPNEITLHDAETGRALATLLSDRSAALTALAYSPDGALLASGALHPRRGVTLWDRSGAALPDALAGGSGEVLSVCFSPDGRLLAAGDAHETIHVWEVASGAEIMACDAGSAVHALAFTGDGARLVAGGYHRASTCWEVPGGTLVGTLPTGTRQAVFALARSPDGRVLATGSANEYEKEGAIRLWDAHTLRELPGRLSNLGDGGSSNGPVYGIAFSADGRLMAAGTSYCLYTWYLG